MKFVVAVLLVVITAGLAYPQSKEIYQLQRDVLDVQQRLKQIQTTIDTDDAALKSLSEKTADQVNMLASAITKLSQAADALKTQNDATIRMLTTLSGTVKELEEGMSSLRSQLNATTRAITDLKTTAEPLAKPDDLWRSAYVDYSAGNYDLAISGLQEFLSKFPNDPRAADAHLMMGQALAAQKKAELAITEYDIVLQKYPESDTTRTALLKKGLALAEANQPQQAIATLNEVVKKFPGTSEANSAQAKLRELQAGQRRGAPARP